MATVVGMGAVEAACSSSSSNGFADSTGPGAGTGSGGGIGGGATGGEGGSGQATEDAGRPPVTSALFVNAMPSAIVSDSALLLCWATVGDAGELVFPPVQPFPSSPMPESNYPGIALGTAVLLPDASSLIAEPVTFVVIRALRLARAIDEVGGDAGDVTCDQLFKAMPRVSLDAPDYFALPAVTLYPDVPNLVAVTGCAPSIIAQAANPQSCGPSYDAAKGNLSAQVFSLSPSSGAAGSLSLQVVQLSPGLAGLLGDAGTATVSFGTTSMATQTLASVGAVGDVSPPSNVLSVPSLDTDGVHLLTPAADGGTNDFFLSLAQAQQLADPTADPTAYYSATGTYVAAIVGDPAAPPPFASSADSGVYDGTGLHFVVAPAQPSN